MNTGGSLVLEAIFIFMSKDFTTSQENHLYFTIEPLNIPVQQVDFSALQGQSQAPEMTLWLSGHNNRTCQGEEYLKNRKSSQVRCEETCREGK